VTHNSDPTRRARELLETAERLVVVTGAGMSAESGVPTFRGPDGLWKSFRPEDLATPDAFRRDPRLVWAWYSWRRSIVAKCEPNAGHRAIARLRSSAGRTKTLVTQNVDGLHQRAAGQPPAFGSEPLELHGSILRDRCSGCGRRSEGRRDIDTTSPGGLPRCDSCAGLLRPDVVWFGEQLDEAVLDSAFGEASQADLCLVIGTSSLVYPAASIPQLARRNGANLIEVNIAETALTPLATLTLIGPAGEVLPTLID
jgi:NAD-dependent deacetylase